MSELARLASFLAANPVPLTFGILVLTGLGLPIPEDVILLAAGASVSLGRTGFYPMVGAALLGVLVADAVLFWLGRRYGPRLLERRPFRYLATPARLERARRVREEVDPGAPVLASGYRLASLLTFHLPDHPETDSPFETGSGSAYLAWRAPGPGGRPGPGGSAPARGRGRPRLRVRGHTPPGLMFPRVLLTPIFAPVLRLRGRVWVPMGGCDESLLFQRVTPHVRRTGPSFSYVL